MSAFLVDILIEEVCVVWWRCDCLSLRRLLVLVCWDVCFLSGYSDRVVSVGWLLRERDIELRDCWWWVGPSKAKLGSHKS